MKVAHSSLLFLSNKKTIFVHLFLLPVINTLFLVSLNYQLTNQVDFAIAIAAIITSSILSIIVNINSSLVYDANNLIDREVYVENKYSSYYWGTKLLLAVVVGYITLIVNLPVLLLFDADFSSIVIALCVMPLMSVYACIVGLVLSSLSQNLNNPYFLVNIIAVFASIVFGSLGTYTQFPPILIILTYAFPFARTMDSIYVGTLNIINIDLLIVGIWLLIGLLSYNRMMLNKMGNSQRSII